jgi:hypothetical protein
MVHECAFSKVVCDKRLACQPKVPPLLSAVKQIGVPDEDIALLSLEVLWL